MIANLRQLADRRYGEAAASLNEMDPKPAAFAARPPFATLEAVSVKRTASFQSLRRTMRFSGLIAAGFVAALVLFLSRTVIAGAVVSQGVLVVDTGPKKIQHQSGGIVRQLLVAEGDRVTAGQPLVVLDRVVTDAKLNAVAASLVQKQARLDRLIAERDGAETLSFSTVEPPIPPDRPGFEHFLDIERRQFAIRREGREGQRRQLSQRTKQAEEEIAGNTAQLDAAAHEIAVVERELVGLRELFDKKLITNERLSEIERSLAQLEGRRGSLKSAIASGKGRVSEIELQILEVDQTLRSDLTDQISQTQQEVSDLIERRTIAIDAQQRSVIASPQDGTVHELSIHTLGGVIQPAEVLMLVVPQADALVGEIKVRPNDIDQLFPGQLAEIHFSAFDRGTTPTIKGTLARVSADLEHDPRTGAMFYKGRIHVDATEMARLDGLPLVAGMPLEVFIRTSDRTIVSYLTKPLTDQINRSFR